ncbi:MAG: hypothetical protein A2418_02185 [Candidatus Brennerbacteria bacterium RIFOXYC1_FULL_41_11]|uniref:Uncharacterized protein n=1 Tax=Candidatus Brennerbacteria bacterium RIFOXYD1_FULL_41_16 TaxID=1797529 RepID=A0A1G1XKY4_9BACT|nr:MAG: hypothetical protein A2418_02185 [Candidatus Brennerbacteria bacterium RIFOXYC1_FULL_41_11]OGY40763.1 MAG: hypothetical protein A2570_01395 [Candidatus Brennerbacteria bacterium RIFOXYD1_FULL_41_16]
MRTKEDEKRIKRDMKKAAKFLDSPEGKKIDKVMSKIQENLKKEKELVVISDVFVQEEAETVLDRELNQDELDEVVETIYEGLTPLVQDSIKDVIEFRKLIDRSRDAEKTRPNYRVYWKNYNAYHSEFSLQRVFGTEKDARSYIKQKSYTPDDEWMIIAVDENGFESQMHL